MSEKKTVPIRCPKSGKMMIFTKADFQGGNVLKVSCSYCGETHVAYLEEEDFSQAAARIVREATEER
jgi:hypothetical protein